MFKEIAAVIATILTVIACFPYLRDTIKGKTTPHLFSWLVWTILETLTFFLFLQNGGGPSTLIMLTVSVITLSITILSIKNGTKDLKPADVGFLILSLFSLGLWLFMDSPTYAAILATSTAAIALIPTIRKSWEQPYSETLSTYLMNAGRHLLVLLSVAELSVITVFNPIIWSLINATVATILITRRKVVKE